MRCCCATSGWRRPPASWPRGSNHERGAARRPSPPLVRRSKSSATRPSAASGPRWSAWSRRSSRCWPWPGSGTRGGMCFSGAWRLPRRSVTSPPRRAWPTSSARSSSRSTTSTGRASSGSVRLGCVRRSVTRQARRSRAPILRCWHPLRPLRQGAARHAGACPRGGRPRRRPWPGLRRLRLSSR